MTTIDSEIQKLETELAKVQQKYDAIAARLQAVADLLLDDVEEDFANEVRDALPVLPVGEFVPPPDVRGVLVVRRLQGVELLALHAVRGLEQVLSDLFVHVVCSPFVFCV